MFSKKDNSGTSRAETIIGPSVLIKGDLTNNENILIKGSVEGNVVSGGHISIAEGANIKADIEAQSADIGGVIQGNLKIKNNLILRSKAIIKGDVECASISIEEGGALNGKCNMTNSEKSKPKEKKLNINQEEENEKQEV